jgi:hypothetical protein
MEMPESHAFNKFALRRLYNLGNQGRGTARTQTRASLHTTISYPTYLALGNLVPVKKGGYGGPVVELGIRLLLYLVGSLSLNTLGEELAQVMLRVRPDVATRLRLLASFIETYTPPSFEEEE